MLEVCTLCGSRTETLRLLKVEQPGNPPRIHQLTVCDPCAARSGDDDYRLLAPDPKEYEFRANKYQGDIGEAVVRAVLAAHDYQLFPFGQESQLGPILRGLRRGAHEVEDKLRSMPDLVAHHPLTQRTFLVEVKSTVSDGFVYSLDPASVRKYHERWPEALVVLVCLPKFILFACGVGQLVQMEHTTVRGSNNEELWQYRPPQQFDDFTATFQLPAEGVKRVVDALIQQSERIFGKGPPHLSSRQRGVAADTA